MHEMLRYIFPTFTDFPCEAHVRSVHMSSIALHCPLGTFRPQFLGLCSRKMITLMYLTLVCCWALLAQVPMSPVNRRSEVGVCLDFAAPLMVRETQGDPTSAGHSTSEFTAGCVHDICLLCSSFVGIAFDVGI